MWKEDRALAPANAKAPLAGRQRRIAEDGCELQK